MVRLYNSVYLTLGLIADFVFQGATDLQQPAAHADGHLAQRDAQHPPKDDHDHHKDPKDHHKDPKDHHKDPKGPKAN